MGRLREYRLAVQMLQEDGRLGLSLGPLEDEGSAGGQGTRDEDSGSESESEWSVMDNGADGGGNGGRQ